MKAEDQIKIINDAINKAKEDLKPLAFNFIFWGVLTISMSLFHYFFSSIVETSKYSALIYWTVLPLIGLIYTMYYNIKIVQKMGFQTVVGRSLSIIWGVFGISWLILILSSLIIGHFPVASIIFLIGVTTLTTGRIIRNNSISIGGIILFFIYLYILTNPDLNLLLINSIGIFFGFLLPGLSLYYKK